jgi:flagellar motor switch protein FliN/FliY
VSSLDTAVLEQTIRAAEAALPLLPLPAGAVVAAGEPAEVPLQWPAVVQRFSGTPSGSCAVVLDPDAAAALTAALDAAAGGPTGERPPGEGLAAACGPALLAAAAALGPTAGLTPEESTGAEVAARPGGGVARIDVAGHAVAFLVLAVAGLPGLPGPRSPEDRAPGEKPPGDRHDGLEGDEPEGRRGIELLRSVPMEITAEIGRTRMTIQELLSLTPGAVVELDRPVGSPADVLVNGRLFARGEVVVVDEDFAIRITEIVDTDETAGP